MRNATPARRFLSAPVHRCADFSGGVLGLACALLLALQACGGGAPLPEIPPVDRVVLITVDTLRADHLGAYGYFRETSPFLDSLAERGILFERAFAPSGTTQPSHASLFTSLYPIQHKVYRNGHLLDDSFVTLAEYLATLGYDTAAFTSTDAHFRWGGLSQGFSTYDELAGGEAAPRPRDEERPGLRDATDLVDDTQDAGADDTEFVDPDAGDPEEAAEGDYRPAAETVDAALGWLEERDPDDRFFLWIHLFDPHRPFRPPAPHYRFIRRQELRARDDFFTFLRERHRLDVRGDRRLQWLLNQYDAEIRYTDAELARLHERYGELGLADGTLWVVTADHGQGLDTHGYFGHAKQIYNTQLHVPLIFHFAGQEPAAPAPRVAAVVEHVDVAPTLLDILGEPPLPQIFPVQGRSLVPLLTGRGELDKEHAFAQRGTAREIRRGDFKPGEAYALQDARYKYHYYDSAEDEFYDLARDPYEQHDLIAEPSRARDRLRVRLLEMIRRLDSQRPVQDVSPEVHERLRALGYIQ